MTLRCGHTISGLRYIHESYPRQAFDIMCPALLLKAIPGRFTYMIFDGRSKSVNLLIDFPSHALTLDNITKALKLPLLHRSM